MRVVDQFRKSYKRNDKPNLLAATRMVVGHTMTSHLGGKNGRILTRQRGRIVCIDVGLGRDPASCAALIIDAKGGQEWTPKGRRNRKESPASTEAERRWLQGLFVPHPSRKSLSGLRSAI